MAQIVTLPALKAFTYQGTAYRRGDLVAMSPLDAAIHARQGRVSLTRTYATRQLVAEPPVSPRYFEAAEPSHVAEYEIAPRRRRRSRKRALETEVAE